MPTYKSILFHNIHNAFNPLRSPGSRRATFGKSKRLIKIGEVPPNRTFPLNGILVIKAGVINVSSKKFIGLPNGSKDPGPSN